jgi:hypothetical protein
MFFFKILHEIIIRIEFDFFTNNLVFEYLAYFRGIF